MLFCNNFCVFKNLHLIGNYRRPEPLKPESRSHKMMRRQNTRKICVPFLFCLWSLWFIWSSC
jgi:hypothetical protein